MHTLIFPDMLL